MNPNIYITEQQSEIISESLCDLMPDQFVSAWEVYDAVNAAIKLGIVQLV